MESYERLSSRCSKRASTWWIGIMKGYLMYIVDHVDVRGEELVGRIITAAFHVFRTGTSAVKSMSMAISSSY